MAEFAQMVEKEPTPGDMAQFYSNQRRALLAQAKAYEQLRNGILAQVAAIEKISGPKIVITSDSGANGGG